MAHPLLSDYFPCASTAGQLSPPYQAPPQITWNEESDFVWVLILSVVSCDPHSSFPLQETSERMRQDSEYSQRDHSLRSPLHHLLIPLSCSPPPLLPIFFFYPHICTFFPSAGNSIICSIPMGAKLGRGRKLLLGS